ncbi:MAG: cyclin [archaeon]|nr:cyclin [archaeon]
MNNSSHGFKKTILKNLIESFQTYSSKQEFIESYPQELLQTRKQIIIWLNYLCKNLSFRKETFFRAVTIYDLFISKSNKNFTLFQLKLTAIACLSLSTKIEEINCNFVEFLTSNVLNSQTEKIYSIKDLALKEIEICKTLKFKLQISTTYQFLTVLQQISFNILGDNLIFKTFLNQTDIFLNTFILDSNYILYSPKDISLYVFNQVLINLRSNSFQSYSKEMGIIGLNISNIIQSVTKTAKVKYNSINTPISQSEINNFKVKIPLQQYSIIQNY